MADYEREFSKFPEQRIKLHYFRNVDDSVASIINQINSLRAAGLYNQAARVIQDNSDILSQCTVDMTTFRTWEEEIYNAQLYALQMQQSIYFDDTEPECLDGDVWIGE